MQTDVITNIEQERQKLLNIKQKEISHFLRGVTRENSSLNGCNSLIRVDALIGLLAIEEVRHELHNA